MQAVRRVTGAGEVGGAGRGAGIEAGRRASLPRTDLQTRSTAQLLADYSDILTELIRRGVTRSRNSPVGDLAEYLAVTAYGGQLPAQSNPAWDFIDADGRRVQVKGLVYASERRGTRKFGGITSWEFDVGLFVVFDARTYQVLQAREVEPEWVRSTAIVSKANGSQLTLAQLKGHGKDVAARLQKAMSSLGDETDDNPLTRT